MMLVIKKKNVVVGILIVLLIITGYLNFAYNQNALNEVYENEPLQDELEDNGNGIKVSDVETGRDSDASTDDEVQAVSSTFFIDFRFEREQTRKKEIEYINAIVENPKSDAEMKKEAQAQLLEITQNMEKELTLENLIKAKGFKDVVVIVHPRSVNVIVDKAELNPEEVAQILSTVKRETGEEAENITIIPKM